MTRPTILGYLAQFGSFSNQSEVLCTQGLAYLLRTHKEARSALADKVKACTGVAIGNGLTWLAEAVQEDGGRPDLEARTATKVPMVKIEAKVGAELLPEQLHSYEADLRKRNPANGVLLVLVPTSQVKSVMKVIVRTFNLPENEPWRVNERRPSGSVVVSIITWDELFSALRGGEEQRFCHELEQLQAMYHVLSGDFIAPLAGKKDLEEWEARETDFLHIVDQATRRLTTQHALYPMGSETLNGASPESLPIEYRRRYACPCKYDGGSCFSIGVRHSFEEWLTPIWMRFHGSTGRFERIRQRLSTDATVQALPSDGHLWIPLHVPLKASGEEMIQAIVDQAEKVLWAAYKDD